jgi:hypothetical protein
VYVKPGDQVKVGQPVGIRKGPFFTQPIHSTVSGEVVGIVKKFHRSGKLVDFIRYGFFNHIKRRLALTYNFHPIFKISNRLSCTES